MTDRDYGEEYRQLKERFERLRGYLDVESTETETAQLELEMGRADFWVDIPTAQRIQREHSRVQRHLAEWRALAGCMDDVAAAFELGREDPEFFSEFDTIAATFKTRLDNAEVHHLLSGEYDAGDAIVSIHPGAGGTESQDWGEMLLRMLLRFAESEGFKTRIVEVSPGDEAGIKSATFTVSGDYAYGTLQSEKGVHRLVRISPFDSNARRQTSFASVFVFPQISDDVAVEIDEKDLRIDTYRSSSAGGQHVNVTDSAVRITHLPTGLVTQCQNERSQHRNRDEAMRVLRSRLYDHYQRERNVALQKVAGEKKEITWGSQIRSYVLQPYQMVKDHRNNLSIGNVEAVLNGDLKAFSVAYLTWKAQQELEQGKTAP
ncbi:MAG: peptide chain release factor 2 [Candidatus Schekmanbacteria bacterium]|nr:peptide chain release factor 2 [Candidatus Schekmanbacteria bacterium]